MKATPNVESLDELESRLLQLAPVSFVWCVQDGTDRSGRDRRNIVKKNVVFPMKAHVMCCVLAISHPIDASAANALSSTAIIGQSDVAKRVEVESAGGFEIAQIASAPIIEALFPTSGPLGTLVAIRGANFTSDGNIIEFRDEQNPPFAVGSPVGSEDRTSLRVVVSTCPAYQPQCPGFYVRPGVYRVTVRNVNGVSNEMTFAVVSR
jgi:hypothetical protein